jgi:hypothetical protein
VRFWVEELGRGLELGGRCRRLDGCSRRGIALLGFAWVSGWFLGCFTEEIGLGWRFWDWFEDFGVLGWDPESQGVLMLFCGIVYGIPVNCVWLYAVLRGV